MILIKGVKLPKIAGIALWPFVVVRPKNPSKTIIFHERIHLRQQLEMLILPFYLWYITEWLLRFIQFRNLHQAYMHISFEKEAYQNESNDDFLNTRPFWNFLKYI
jgi:hypothetical protein